MSAHNELLDWDRRFYAEILPAHPPESLKEHKDLFWVHNRAMLAMVRVAESKFNELFT